MNKRQKEVLTASLDDEKAVLEKLKKNYSAALADIKRNIKELQSNPLTQSKAYQLEFQKQLEKQLSGVLDNLEGKNFASISDYLNTCYNNGFLGSMYDIHGQGVPIISPINQNQVLKAVQKTGDDVKLSTKLNGNTAELKKQVLSELQRGFSTSMSYTDIARNISNHGEADMNRSMRIARTEGHRVQQEAKIDSLHIAKSKGADIVKQWDSTLDGKTRDTHRQLDGQIVELDEDFTIDGMSAPYPGGFGDPAEDCNCRCTILQRAKWALDESELETLKERAEYFGLDKTDDFNDFCEKYLKAAESIDNSAEDDKIESERYTDFATIDECKKFAKDVLQLDVTNYELMNVNVANAVNKEILAFYDTFGNIHDSGELEGIRILMGKHDFVAAYSPQMKELFFKKNNVGFKTSLSKLEKEAKEQFGFGFWSTSSPLQSIRHELGHSVQHMYTDAKAGNPFGNSTKKLREIEALRINILNDCGITKWSKYDTEEHLLAAGKVISYYGLKDNGEFIAESVAEYMNGNPRETAKEVVEILLKKD